AVSFAGGIDCGRRFAGGGGGGGTVFGPTGRGPSGEGGFVFEPCQCGEQSRREISIALAGVWRGPAAARGVGRVGGACAGFWPGGKRAGVCAADDGHPAAATD